MDCVTRLATQSALALKSAGIAAVGRYLGCCSGSWKALTPAELQAIHKAGLSLLLIWETNPTFAGYFSFAQGLSDAKEAVGEAGYLGAPKGSALRWISTPKREICLRFLTIFALSGRVSVSTSWALTVPMPL
ncbi:glycoside hydrolase domain-containing protein [Acididesulfobacillus acetoxydans]|nr:glycoside hydrolase domain-containing protein [Acididesulfobacillus acetoxydans]